jgi:hypothetical protein
MIQFRYRTAGEVIYMRGDIDIRLLDYYIYDLTKLSETHAVSEKQEKAEPSLNQSEEKSSPGINDKH